ncbi:MFS transporter [Enterococcus malodoratus]|uniref:MFS transporter n=1 Tax=Enterococcus malodoratus TaxID=71451 RepID=UPI0039AFF29F
MDSKWKRRIALFLSSQNISLFGSQMVSFSIVWYITLETSSGVWLMLSTICSMLPQAIISLWGGVWADRYDRKKLIIAADAFIASVTLMLVIFFHFGHTDLKLLLIVSIFRSIGAGIQTPAVNSIFPELVPEEQLTRVQGINQTLASALMLITSGLGGLVINLWGLEWAFIIDVITAVIAITIMSCTKVQQSSKTKIDSKEIIVELKEGLSYTIHHKNLRNIIGCYAISYILFTPAATLAPLLIERTFGSELWRLSTGQIIWGIGSMVGGLLISILGNFKDKYRVVALSLAVFGILTIFEGMATNFFIYLILVGLTGILIPIVVTLQTVSIQEEADNRILGRIFSFVQIITASSMPIAILIFGPLADVVTVQSILIFTGIFLTISGIVYYRKTRIFNR